MFSVDLQDAYFQIPIHQESRPYLRFSAEGCVYQFKVLCFCLSMTPQVFSRVFALVSEWAHRRGVRHLRYMDDCLVVAESQNLLLRHQTMLFQLCPDLGIVVSLKKSDLVLRTGIPIQVSSVTVPRVCPHHFLTPSSSSSHVAAPSRSHVTVRTIRSGGPRSHEAPPEADEGSLVTSGRQHILPIPPVSGMCPGYQVVARRGQMDKGRSSSHSTPVPVVIYRRVPVGLGCSSSGPHGIGSMVRQRSPGAHQHPGDAGRRTGPGIVSFPACRTECRPDERQCVSCSFTFGIRTAHCLAGYARWRRPSLFGRNVTPFVVFS